MKKAIAISLCAVTMLAACGGGGGGGEESPATAPAEQVPDSASQSTDGLVAYLRTLLAASADALEPVDVSTFTPMASETAEPEVVN